MNQRASPNLFWMVVVLAAVSLACKGTARKSTAASASAEASPAGLDGCLVGHWRSTKTTLKNKMVTAEGGANALMVITPDGKTVIDYTHVAPMYAKSNVEFDFTYSGKGQAVVHTPARGALAWSEPDISGLRVTANAKFPGGKSLVLFKNTPLTELAPIGKDAAPSAGRAPGSPAGGIDDNRVFSADSYSCTPTTLVFKCDRVGAEWDFARGN